MAHALIELDARGTVLMQERVRKQNIAEFRRLLAATTDAEQRRILLQLLKEEKEKEPPAPRVRKAE
jgi:hypothetical protein